MNYVFWISFLIICYIYFGYPLLLYLLCKIRKMETRRDEEYRPMVSLIIAAYNEEGVIADKIENTLDLDYPKDRIEIIVASDCSTDLTDKIVGRYADKGVILNRQSLRLGKTAAQNDSVPKANGEILVFSDATTIYEKESIKKLVRNFRDESVGCVGGELTYETPTDDIIGKGGGLYWKYEKWLRNKESRVCSVIGVSGCMYAVRRSIYRPIDSDLISDFVIASLVYEHGYRAIHEPEAKCYEDTTKAAADEFKMRVRVAVRSLRALWHKMSILNPLKYGLYSMQLWSHKVLRYLVPLFLICILFSNVFLLSDDFYLFAFLSQVFFYLSALSGHLLARRHKRIRLLLICYYFVLLNVAAAFAMVRFLRGEKSVIWEPIRD